MIDFKCQVCGNGLRVPDEHAGQEVTCMVCRGRQYSPRPERLQEPPPPKRAPWPRWAIISIALVTIYILCVVLNPGDRGPERTGGVPRATPGAAEIGKRSKLRKCMVAVSSAAHDRMLNLSIAKDHLGLAQMNTAGLIFIAEDGTEAQVIGRGGLYVREVRIMSGEHFGQSGFVAYEFLY